MFASGAATARSLAGGAAPKPPRCLSREPARFEAEGSRPPLLPSGTVSASAASAAEPQRRIRPRLVYGIAGVLLLVAALLSLADVGEKAGRLSDWQAFVLGVTQGADRAAADLLVGPPDPRAVDRGLALPRGAPGLQQDLRRRAPPRHARRRRRLLLGRRDAVRGRLVPLGRPPPHPDDGRADRVVDLRGHDPGRDRRRARRVDDRRKARPAVADRDLPERLRRAALRRRPLRRSSGGSSSSASGRRSGSAPRRSWR